MSPVATGLPVSLSFSVGAVINAATTFSLLNVINAFLKGCGHCFIGLCYV